MTSSGGAGAPAQTRDDEAKDRYRCICTMNDTEPRCPRRATQEDMLCDGCRVGACR